MRIAIFLPSSSKTILQYILFLLHPESRPSWFLETKVQNSYHWRDVKSLPKTFCQQEKQIWINRSFLRTTPPYLPNSRSFWRLLNDATAFALRHNRWKTLWNKTMRTWRSFLLVSTASRSGRSANWNIRMDRCLTKLLFGHCYKNLKHFAMRDIMSGFFLPCIFALTSRDLQSQSKTHWTLGCIRPFHLIHRIRTLWNGRLHDWCQIAAKFEASVWKLFWNLIMELNSMVTAFKNLLDCFASALNGQSSTDLSKVSSTNRAGSFSICFSSTVVGNEQMRNVHRLSWWSLQQYPL